jgi:hypothetical protein
MLINSPHISGSLKVTGNSVMTGSLTVTGQVIAQTLNVQQVTSSIIYSSGSNVFGNSLANTQQFTGSVSVTGSLSVNNTPAVLGSGTTNYVTKFTTAGTVGNSGIFESGGNVGIGTTSPGYGLDIQSSDASKAYINLTFTGFASTFLQAFNGIGLTGTRSNDPFAIATNNTERMRITSGGSLLIGGTNDVAGGIIQAISSSGTGVTIRSTNPSGTQPKLNFFHDDNDVFSISGGANLRFLSSGVTERMRITSDGNVGIGGSITS